MGNALKTPNECFEFILPPCLIIAIKTGDTTSTGLHNTAYIQLVDQFGRESEEILLQGCSLTVFKKGHTDSFRITKLPLDFGTVRKIKLFRKETKQNIVEWYVERIEIRYHKMAGPEELLVFPCNRWIRNDKAIVLTLYDSCLPQLDKDSYQRDAELFSKRAKYRYCPSISGVPPRVSQTPSLHMNHVAQILIRNIDLHG
jgi:hypothetical protein